MIIHICDLCGKKVDAKEIVNMHFGRVDISKFFDICPDCFNEILGKAKALREAQEHGDGATE